MIKYNEINFQNQSKENIPFITIINNKTRETIFSKHKTTNIRRLIGRTSGVKI